MTPRGRGDVVSAREADARGGEKSDAGVLDRKWAATAPTLVPPKMSRSLSHLPSRVVGGLGKVGVLNVDTLRER